MTYIRQFETSNPRTIPGLILPLLRWLYCLMRNQDYEKYCKAKKLAKTHICEEMENEFPRLSEIYQDWGDVYESDLLCDSIAQRDWCVDKYHLFEHNPIAKWVEDAENYKYRAGYELLDVPLMKTKAETLTIIKKHLDFVYKYRELAVEKSKKPLARLIYQELPVAKYRFHPKGGKLSAATKLAVKKAFYVDELRQKTNDKGKPLSLTETVLAIKQDPENPFGWTLTEEDKRDLQRGVFKKGLFSSSEVTLVRRARSDFDAYVRNTIHGRFPDNS